MTKRKYANTEDRKSNAQIYQNSKNHQRILYGLHGIAEIFYSANRGHFDYWSAYTV